MYVSGKILILRVTTKRRVRVRFQPLFIIILNINSFNESLKIVCIHVQIKTMMIIKLFCKRRIQKATQHYCFSVDFGCTSKFFILHNDEHFISLCKPAEMLSVPGKYSFEYYFSKIYNPNVGKGEMALASRLPRHEEWHSSIVAVNALLNAMKFNSSDYVKIVLKDLSIRINVPRTLNGFKEQMIKSYPLLQERDVLDIWKWIIKCDKELHAIEFDTINDIDKSVATILSDELKINLYHIHRY